jgi:phage gpG-like protein
VLQLKLSDDGAQARITGLDRAAAQLGPVFAALRRPLLEDQRAHAMRAEGPEGAWPGWRKVRGRWRSNGGRSRSRRPLGRLPRATQTRSSGRQVYVRSVVRWAWIHQEGGTAGKGARIAARPFLWISTGLQSRAGQMIADHLARGWNGAR